MRITIQCAMQAEADAVIGALGLAPERAPWAEYLPARLWAGPVGGTLVHLVTNGRDERTGADLIGTTPATLAATIAIGSLRPGLLLVAGAAGGRSGSTAIGEVLLIDRAFHHDRRIPLPEFAGYAHGPEALDHSPALAGAFGVRTATISTGNGLDTLPHELGFFDQRGITVKDMETASIAWVAAQHRTPVAALRSITDFFDHPTPEHQFLANFDRALENLAATVAAGLPRLVAG
jgi:adenosylhomocysteine nucleosidase/5'-methylthioadenosine nucleosidase